MRLNTAGTLFKILAVIALLMSLGAFFMPYIAGISGFDTFKATIEYGSSEAWTELIFYIIGPMVLLVIAAFILVGNTNNGGCIAVIVLSVIALVLYLYPIDFRFSEAFEYMGWGYKLTLISCICGIVFPVLIMICGRDKGGSRAYTMEDDFHNR